MKAGRGPGPHHPGLGSGMEGESREKGGKQAGVTAEFKAEEEMSQPEAS